MSHASLWRVRPAVFFNGFAAILVFLVLWAGPSLAQVTAHKQAIAEAASDDSDIAAFYRDNDYQPIWTGADEADQARRAALIRALSSVSLHGLPEGRYDPAGLIADMAAARTTRDLGLLEVELSRVFLRYARDVHSGILIPSKIDEGMARKVLYLNRTDTLSDFSRNAPGAFLAGLAPQTREYHTLMNEKLRLENLVARGGWGPAIAGGALKLGQTGAAVVALRDRLVRMAYLNHSATRTYDGAIQTAVQRFQEAHGLDADGVAGKGTIAQINVSAEKRLQSVIVAMERERWLNRDLGDRHILVNLTDFTARIVDFGAITFQTRSVVGKNATDRRSPEFSDQMEHMIINPSWYVPRSIMTKEYLPKLKNNPNAASHLIITDRQGRRVDRSQMDFSQFTERNFPFDMRQPPGARNALGKVKFMFPNKYNIYLHDTPERNLFLSEVRAFSHGCIRLADPFDFAYAILARQTPDPKTFFQRILATGQETKVVLDQPIPVHLIYRTAFSTATGTIEFRRDIYRRDAKIWAALSQAGVALNSVRG